MGLIVFIVLAAAEIALAVWAGRSLREKKEWRKGRLLVRAAQLAIVVIAMLLPFGQRWRFAAALGLAVLLLVIAALALLAGRRKDGAQKKGGAVASCVLSIVLFALCLVPAFVFTGYNGLPVTGGYEIAEASAILVDGARTDPFEQDGSAREVPVHFYYPVTEEGGEEAFPLVLFSHGAFGYYQSNTSTYCELASHGYVVAALDHPHHAFFTQDTDGQLVLVDGDFMNTALNLSGYDDPAMLYGLYRDWMDLRTADMGFVLDTLEAAAESGALDESWFLPENDEGTILSVLGETDTTRVGLMGHSMGGAASVALGRMRDDIDAVIDIDGTMLSEYTGVADGEFVINEEPYTVPVLAFDNWESYNELAEYLADGGRYPNDELVKHAAQGYAATIRDTKHMDFTDLPLLSPLLGSMLGSGERDSAETMGIVNGVVLDFCDCYLKGEGVFTVQDIY